ncbi:MAG: hypothetical protein K0S27_728, partial [Gammaproteobacteria bacterium]|nr:hypothetical protein [Gammaproteobacteria bacterium]
FARPRWNALIFEHRSAVDMRVNEHRSTENQSVTAGIVELPMDPRRIAFIVYNLPS